MFRRAPDRAWKNLKSYVFLFFAVHAINPSASKANDSEFFETSGARMGFASVPEVEASMKSDPVFSNALGEGDTLYFPASTTKIFTAFTALRVLTENFRYETKIQWNVVHSANGSVFPGIANLKFFGGGDPTWTFSDPAEEKFRKVSAFTGFIETLKRENIRFVLGPIQFLSQDSAHLDFRGAAPGDGFREVITPNGWDEPEKAGKYFTEGKAFGALPSSFFFHRENGSKSEPDWGDEDLFIFRNFGCSSGAPTQAQKNYRKFFPHVQVVCGECFRNQSTVLKWDPKLQKFTYCPRPKRNEKTVEKADVPNTAAATVIRLENQLLKELRENGIEYREKSFETVDVKKEIRSYSIFSRPIAEILRVFLQESVNRYGESLVVQIGRSSLRRSGNFSGSSYAEGLRIINEDAYALSRKGAAFLNEQARGWSEGIELHDGCGLSRRSKVTPRFMVQILQGIREQMTPERFTRFIQLLAFPEGNGTLKGFSDVSLKGVVRGKTGTLRDVHALVGYVYGMRGDTWVPFAIFEGLKNNRKTVLVDVVQKVNEVF